MATRVTRTAGRRRTSDVAPADLEQALTDLGIRISRSDDDEVHGWCPGHLQYTGKEDRRPSWSVNRTTGYQNCFSCSFHGTFNELVRYMLQTDSPFIAARWIRQYGLNLEAALALPDWDGRLEPPAPRTEVSEDALAAFWQPIPQWELDDRRLTREACEHFDIRWSGEEDCWVIPIRMPDGVLAGWQLKGGIRRRGYFNNVPKRVPKSQTLFGLHQFPAGVSAKLVESPLDVPYIWQCGVEGGLANFGDTVSAAQMRLVRSLTDEIVVARDNDAAGWPEARRLRDGDGDSPPYRRMFVMSFYTYPRNVFRKDPGDCEPYEVRKGFREAQHALIADLGGEPSSPANSGFTNRTASNGFSPKVGSSLPYRKERVKRRLR